MKNSTQKHSKQMAGDTASFSPEDHGVMRARSLTAPVQGRARSPCGGSMAATFGHFPMTYKRKKEDYS